MRSANYRSSGFAVTIRLLLLVAAALVSGCGGGGGGSASASGSSSSGGSTSSSALTATAGGPYSATVGQAITLNGSATAGNGATIVSYAWDLNNDGQYDNASGASVSYTPTAAGTYTIGLKVTDNYGDSATDSATLTVAAAGPSDGYNLYAPLSSTTTYLMDNNGNIVHSWATGYRPGLAVYLLSNGDLLHTGYVANSTFGSSGAGGAGGIVQTFDWNGNLLWQYEYSSSQHLQNHDVAMLPNGDVLMIAWDYKTSSEAIAAGRNPNLLSDNSLWPESIIEVKPSGSNGGTIVWQWNAWDHLIQDYDSSKPNYGVVADHPELIDLNFAPVKGADWTHINSIAYDADRDQILLSVHNFSEIWVIDHSTTTAEAAGHTGGQSGKGGDLLYRWGNPQAYGAGTATDQQLFEQHDAHWIGTGLQGAGDILIFNNGVGRPSGDYSSVDEIVPPVDSNGSYTLTKGAAYGPTAPVWSYTAANPTGFFARNMSSAQRLPNGDTLICNGPSAYAFEINSAGTTVWDYDLSSVGAVFRMTRYAPSFAGFAGTSLAGN